jgi:hypothetical protein
MIRTALVWIAVGYTLGALVLYNKGVPFWPWLWQLRSAHVQVLLVGWLVQFAAGMAFWILPRLDPHGARGNERLVWASYLLLNSGVILAALHDPLAAALRAPLATAEPALTRVMIGGAGVCYMLAAALFALHAWRRVVPFRTFPRS